MKEPETDLVKTANLIIKDMSLFNSSKKHEETELIVEKIDLKPKNPFHSVPTVKVE